MAGLDDGKDLRVRQVHPRGVARGGIGVERERAAFRQRGRIGGEAADPELGAL
jgi:hypothetical protein